MTVSLPTRLLVFDHDALGENFLNHMLDPENYEVIKVSSNTFGLLTSRTREPDVIVINLMQPSVDGWLLCHKLRQISQVPILVLAAVSDPKSIARWLDAGADDYLTRPFSAEVLVAHLQKLTRRTRLSQNSTPFALLH